VSNRTLAFAETFVAQDRFLAAAQRYCEAKDRERAIVAALKKCEHRAYFTGIGESGPEYSQPEKANHGNEFCSRVIFTVHDGYEGREESLPVEQWCQSCRDNIPLVEELRVVRRQIPGRMSAMRRGYRKELAHV
jgi:hypothetical protein